MIGEPLIVPRAEFVGTNKAYGAMTESLKRIAEGRLCKADMQKEAASVLRYVARCEEEYKP